MAEIENQFAALIVSASALLTSIVALAIQRKHMRLSVRPIASVSLRDFLDESYVGLDNRGIGPLMVKRLRVTDSENREESNVISFMPYTGEEKPWAGFRISTEGLVVQPGESARLIQMSYDTSVPEDSELRGEIRRALAGLTIQVEFEDIYERTMPAVSKKLDLFAR